MASLLTTLGWLGLGGALLYFIVQDRASTGDVQHIQQTKSMLVVSASLLAAGYLLKFLNRYVRTGGARCKKCKKRIDKGEMFCFDHRREIIWDAQDKHRLSDTGKYKKPL